MDSEANPLHILFFPYMAPGHMNPMIDIAVLFARHGVKVSILTTPANVPLMQPAIDHANSNHHHHPITIILIPFPSTEVGLPEGCENYYTVPVYHPDPYNAFLKAVDMLQQPFDQVLTDIAPHCIVSDVFLPWTNDIAVAHGVPRLVFHGTSYSALCAPDTYGQEINDYTSGESFGVMVNSFYELEPLYVRQYLGKVRGMAWHVGPASLANEDEEDMCKRGGTSSHSEPCMQWLENKASDSVVYVCFGSTSCFTKAQLCEIALALEACNNYFIWVVGNDYFNHHELPRGYERRIKEKGKGLIITGWAPQVLILNNPAVGGFVTHCGWNSCLEAVSAGVPLITWPLFADQFNNERLMVDVLGVGVSLGVTEVVNVDDDDMFAVEAIEIQKAVDELMGGGEEAENRRRSAKLLRVQAQRALQKGGSSYDDIESLIAVLTTWWSYEPSELATMSQPRGYSARRTLLVQETFYVVCVLLAYFTRFFALVQCIC